MLRHNVTPLFNGSKFGMLVIELHLLCSSMVKPLVEKSGTKTKLFQ